MSAIESKRFERPRRRPRPMIGRFGLRALVLAGFVLMSVPRSANANLIHVTSDVEFTLECSLREAIANHNAKGSVGFDICEAGAATIPSHFKTASSWSPIPS